jgi:hypothetical protein
MMPSYPPKSCFSVPLVGAAALALALAGCSRSANEDAPAVDTASEATAEAAAVAEAAADSAGAGAASAPGANPSVASGVAFAYRFNFRLADDAVSQAQDRHVSACEALGQSRCRVTGMRYTQREGGPVEATLAFLLDPALTRSFARDAVGTVRDLDGTLVDSSVDGEDVGTGITASQRGSAAMGGDLARIERRLAQPGLSAGERRDLRAQAETLRARLRDEEQGRRGGEARLASTPVEFAYRGTTGIAGFDSSRPFASAFAASSDSFGSAAAFVMTLIGLILPWALMAGGVVLAVRWLRRRMVRVQPATSS